LVDSLRLYIYIFGSAIKMRLAIYTINLFLIILYSFYVFIFILYLTAVKV